MSVSSSFSSCFVLSMKTALILFALYIFHVLFCPCNNSSLLSSSCRFVRANGIVSSSFSTSYNVAVLVAFPSRSSCITFFRTPVVCFVLFRYYFSFSLFFLWSGSLCSILVPVKIPLHLLSYLVCSLSQAVTMYHSVYPYRIIVTVGNQHGLWVCVLMSLDTSREKASVIMLWRQHTHKVRKNASLYTGIDLHGYGLHRALKNHSTSALLNWSSTRWMFLPSFGVTISY